MAKRSRGVLVLTVLLLGCGMPLFKAPPPMPPPMPLLPDDVARPAPNEQYQVFSVVLQHEARDDRRLVLVDSTLSGPDLRGFAAFTTYGRQGPSPAILDSLYPQLRGTRAFFRIDPSALQGLPPVRPVGINDSVQMDRNEDGVWALMPAVFNADTTGALVYVQVKCGPLCGTGQLVLLARRPGRRWVIWFVRRMWVS